MADVDQEWPGRESDRATTPREGQARWRLEAVACRSSWRRARPPTPSLARVTAETNSAGEIHIVGVDNLGNIWQSIQTSANASTYSFWGQLGGQLHP